MNPAETLRAAAEGVRTGWMQNGFHSSTGITHCALGWIENVATGRLHQVNDPHIDFNNNEAVMALAEVINHPYYGFNAANKIAIWNNFPHRTAEEVALKIEYAALCWEEEQKMLKEQQLLQAAVNK